MRGRHWSRVVAALLCGVGVVACSASAPEMSVPSTRLDPVTTGVGSSQRSPTTSRREPGRITINFAGDISFEPPRAGLLRSDPGAILGAIEPILSAADLTVVNLETAVTDRGTPAPKEFTFRTSPSALDVLANAGVDVASMANNHGLDYGPVGVEDALAASKDRGFPLIGIGVNEAHALTPYRVTVRANRVAVIAATQVLDTELIESWTATPDHPGLASAKRVDQLLARVKAVRPSVDTLVVFLHWGVERETCPSDDQKGLALRLVEAGADIIVGGHAHRVQGAGRMGDAIVNYGLGNFAFYAGGPEAATTGVFRVTTGGGQPAEFEWRPARIDQNGSPVPLTGSAADQALTSWHAARGCTGLEP